MTIWTPPSYLQDGARTVAEMKTAFEQNLAATKEMLGALPIQQVTISGTSVTPAAGAAPFLNIATPSGAASANLTNVVPTNIKEGTLLILRMANSGQVVVAKHAAGGSGQMNFANGQDLTLADFQVIPILFLSGTTWYEVGRFYGSAQSAAHRAFYGAAGLGQNRFTARQEFTIGAPLTAASTLAVDASANYFLVNGSATINGMAVAPAGTAVTLLFSGTPLLVQSSTFALPGGQNLQVQAGQVLDFISDGGGVWRMKGGAGVGAQVLFRSGATIALQNTAVETGMFACTIPPGSLTSFRRLKIEALILLADTSGITVGNQNVQFRLLFGGVQMALAAIVTGVTDGSNVDQIGPAWSSAGLLTAEVADTSNGGSQRGQLMYLGASRPSNIATPFNTGGSAPFATRPLLGAIDPAYASAGAGGGNVNVAVAQTLQVNGVWALAHPNSIMRWDHVVVTLE